MPADEAVETMLAHMTDPANASHLPLSRGEPSCFPGHPLHVQGRGLTLLAASQVLLWCWW